jgi:hypothetical protein
LKTEIFRSGWLRKKNPTVISAKIKWFLILWFFSL